MRPWDSVLGIRWTRCTPLSNFMTEKTLSPVTLNSMVLKPPASEGLDERTSVFQARVHVVEVTGEDGGLVATDAGADLDDGVLLVVGVARDQHDLDLVLEGRQLGLIGTDVLLEHLLLGRIRGLALHLLGNLDVIEGTDVLARLGDELGLAGMLFCDARVLLGVRDDGGIDHPLLELLVRGDELL